MTEYCVDSNKCLNKGTYTTSNLSPGYFCNCIGGFQGEYCQLG